METLAQRKASLYGRVLTDLTLAEEMQNLANFHGERVQALAELMGEEPEKMSGGAEDEA
jgi:hypothetical protein